MKRCLTGELGCKAKSPHLEGKENFDKLDLSIEAGLKTELSI
jgi:hypothetical protein